MFPPPSRSLGKLLLAISSPGTEGIGLAGRKHTAGGKGHPLLWVWVLGCEVGCRSEGTPPPLVMGVASCRVNTRAYARLLMHFLASQQCQELQHHPGGFCPSLGLGKVLGGSAGLHGEC